MHNNSIKSYIFIDRYDKRIFDQNITNLSVIYRNYQSKNRYKDLLKIARKCKKLHINLFVSNDLKLALKVKAFGLYMPSFNKKSINVKHLGKKILVLGSAHNQAQIQQKIKQGCKDIFLSPIFKTQKYKKKQLGITKFNLLTLNYNVSFYALGGINKYNFKKLKLLKIKGFGGISFFKKKPASFEAGF